MSSLSDIWQSERALYRVALVLIAPLSVVVWLHPNLGFALFLLSPAVPVLILGAMTLGLVALYRAVVLDICRFCGRHMK